MLVFYVFSTVHHTIELFHQPTLTHNFLYSLIIRLLHYYPRHVSSINMPIFRRKNCIYTQHLVSSLSVKVCTVHWLRADSQLVDEIILLSNYGVKMVLLLIIIRKTVLEKSLNDFCTYLDLHLSIQLTMCLMHSICYVSLSTD